MKKLKTLIPAAILLMSSLVMGQDVRYQHSVENDNSLVRLQGGYSLPADIKGFSFVDLYGDGTYFGKTYLSKEIIDGTSVKTTTKHANEHWTSTAIGIEEKVPYLPEGTNAKIYLQPFHFDEDGFVDALTTIGYSAGTSIGPVDISSFAEWSISEGNVGFGYGELEAQVKLTDHIKVGYHGVFRNYKTGDGTTSAGIDLEHGLSFTIGLN